MPQTGSLPGPITLPRGTKDMLKRTAAESKRDELNHRGAALTYCALLSLFRRCWCWSRSSASSPTRSV